MKILFSYTVLIKYSMKFNKNYTNRNREIFVSNAKKWQLKFLRIDYLRSYFLLHTFFIHVALLIFNLNDSVQIDCCKSIKPVFV